MDFLQLLKDFGPLAGAVLFFIWRDWKREDRLTTRIEKLEDETRKVIIPLVEKATAVIAENTLWLQVCKRGENNDDSK